MPHPTSERVNLKREAWRELLVRLILYRKYDHSQSFPRLERNTPAREGLRNGKAEAPPVLSFGEVALFRIFGKATKFPKIRKLTKWPTGGGAFSDQGERKLSVAPTRTFLRRATV